MIEYGISGMLLVLWVRAQWLLHKAHKREDSRARVMDAKYRDYNYKGPYRDKDIQNS